MKSALQRQPLRENRASYHMPPLQGSDYGVVRHLGVPALPGFAIVYRPFRAQMPLPNGERIQYRYPQRPCRRRISSRSSRSSRDKKTSASVLVRQARIFFAALRLCVRFPKTPNVDHLSSGRARIFFAALRLCVRFLPRSLPCKLSLPPDANLGAKMQT